MSRVSDLDRTLAANVKALRLAAGITQAQVGRFLGVTYQTYQKIEGGRSVFRVDLLVSFARLYAVSPLDLLLPHNSSVWAMNEFMRQGVSDRLIAAKGQQ